MMSIRSTVSTSSPVATEIAFSDFSEHDRRGRRSKLTPEVQSALIAALERGCFDRTACAAAGIAPSTLYLWLAKGRQRADGPYHALLRAVTQARAKVRAEAEARVFAENPLVWLRCGPGRTRKGSPGWSDGPEAA
jgi:hypothetical protein